MKFMSRARPPNDYTGEERELLAMGQRALAGRAYIWLISPRGEPVIQDLGRALRNLSAASRECRLGVIALWAAVDHNPTRWMHTRMFCPLPGARLRIAQKQGKF